MAGVENNILFGDGLKLLPSSATDISNMQETNSVSDVNFVGNPNGSVAANPGSICRDPSGGTLYLKVTGTGNTGWSLVPSGTSVPTSFATDSGTATPAANVITFNAISQAGATVKFSGASSTVSLNVTDASFNTFVGQASGNITLSGNDNTSIGYDCLPALTTGHNNCCMGTDCGKAVTTGHDNSVVGSQAFQTATTGQQNTLMGFQAGNLMTSGSFNTGYGYANLQSATTDQNNTAIGFLALNALKASGGNNTAVGHDALAFVVTGSNNTALGYQAGENLTTNDSNNIHIGNLGTAGDNAKIVIGTSGTHTTAFLAGVSGVSVANKAYVTMNTSTGQMGTTALSGVFTWSDQSGSFSAVVSNGYFITGASTPTLPASPSEGDTISFILDAAALCTITANTGQKIRVGAAISASAGTTASSVQGNSITLVYRSTGTTWIALNNNGTWLTT